MTTQVYIRLHAYICLCMPTPVYQCKAIVTYDYTRLRMPTHAYICLHMTSYDRSYIPNSRLHTFIHAYLRVRICLNTPTHVYIHIRTHIYAYIRIYPHMTAYLYLHTYTHANTILHITNIRIYILTLAYVTLISKAHALN